MIDGPKVSPAQLAASVAAALATALAADGGGGGIGNHGARGHRTGTQPAANVETTMVYDFEDWDSDAILNPATGFFTVPVGQGGKWIIAAGLDPIGVGSNYLGYRINGGALIEFGGSVGQFVSGSDIANLAAGDTVEIRCYALTGFGVDSYGVMQRVA